MLMLATARSTGSTSTTPTTSTGTPSTGSTGSLGSSGRLAGGVLVLARLSGVVVAFLGADFTV